MYIIQGYEIKEIGNENDGAWLKIGLFKISAERVLRA